MSYTTAYKIHYDTMSHTISYYVVYDIEYHIVYDISCSYYLSPNPSTHDLLFCQAVGRRGRGRQDIDIHLLKPARFRPDSQWALPPDVVDGVVHNEVLDPEAEWMTYEFRMAHPILRWLPTKLAEWIGANLSDELRIPMKSEDKWIAAELNSILINNVVRGSHGHLRTFGGIKWECDLFNGRPKARCYPFDIDGHRFRDKNPQV